MFGTNSGIGRAIQLALLEVKDKLIGVLESSGFHSIEISHVLESLLTLNLKNGEGSSQSNSIGVVIETQG